MQLTNMLVTTLATFIGLSNAACTITGYSGQKCDGASGNVDTISSSGRCVLMGGRQSYKLSGDCGTVEVLHYGSDDCGSNQIDAGNKGSGCHGVAAASVKVKTV